MYVSLYWSANTMFVCPMEDVAYEFVLTSPAESSMSCSSDLDVLWDGRQVLFLISCWTVRQNCDKTRLLVSLKTSRDKALQGKLCFKTITRKKQPHILCPLQRLSWHLKYRAQQILNNNHAVPVIRLSRTYKRLKIWTKLCNATSFLR